MDRFSTEHQRQLIDQVGRLIAERAQSETSILSSNAAREAATNSQFAGEKERLNVRFTQEKRALQSQHNGSLANVTREYELSVERATAEHDQAYRRIVEATKVAAEKAHAERDKSNQHAQNAFEEAVRDTKQALDEFKEKLETRRGELRELETTVERETLRRRWCLRTARHLPEKEGVCSSARPIEQYAGEVAAAEQCRQNVRGQWLPKLLAFRYLIAVFFLLWIVMTVVGLAMEIHLSLGEAGDSLTGILFLTVTGGLASGVTAIIWVLVRQPAVTQTLQVYEHFQQHIANADICLDAARTLAAAEADQRRETLRQQLEQELRQADDERKAKIARFEMEREQRLQDASDKLQQERQAAVETRNRKQPETNRHFEALIKQQQADWETHNASIAQRHEQELATSRETFERAWSRLTERWSSGLSEFTEAINAMQDYCEARFPDWKTTDWGNREPLDETVPALQFGQYRLNLNMFEGGIPDHPHLAPPQTEFVLPAAMSFARNPTLLFEAFGDGRQVANQAMQNVMLRLLTSLPPGKVRFTIIDPVGLGQNFSAFMHLADFDEKLVSHRIWTESTHITTRLADLTEHMEDVIQTYLRNEFKTIDQYNEFAGEVAEPFHILAIANFPAGFSEEAAQRLLSIVTSGSKCGVYSLISTDSKLDLPRNFSLADLEANAAAIQWDGNRFHWIAEDIKDLPLTLDEPPTDDLFTEIIRTVGQRAKDAIRVEVPFSTVAPKDDQWWTRDSRESIDVALGRAGATKLQELRLGKGTSQHVLISGKTGSGKSTLLHALIANTALHYGPDELHFYLIDFKKGVEFKPYATYRLPHARVVAIESEREFGMSVLERLDLELRTRGDLFREEGVQDIRSYRDANPERAMPRILLIIDEFQEFFVQDDKLAQDAGLLLDRLVRQGRAFGIHVLLGSQTLAGAYSLARSTIGQMAVRIALQCSEADSHLILSEENTAARLLSRPGEAIYNDANGMFEGNHPFQVVWLSSEEQEQYLRKLVAKSEQAGSAWPAAIVFEGNAPADPSDNATLCKALRSDEHTPGLAPQGWLGSAVAIKDPTSITLRRQSGGNLLMVGQHEEMVMGVFGNALISLAATSPIAPDSGEPAAKFHIFDGTRPDAPETDFWRRVVDGLPLCANIVDVKDTASIISSISAEVRRRTEAADDTASPVFLFIYNLPRFRDLRRADDDFGFSSFDDDKPAAPGKQFAEILRDGPAVGVHSLVWSDTFNNVNRWFDRTTLRDLDLRVLCQMSATDSSNLMDSPAASRLGVHRALLYSEELGEYEKFRPYAPPSDDWLAFVREQLATRASDQSLA